MAEREKNAAFWKQMRARHTRKVSEYARKYGVDEQQAALELEYAAMLDRDDRQFLIEEGLRPDPSSNRSEEE
jgi:hypothetical protein